MEKYVIKKINIKTNEHIENEIQAIKELKGDEINKAGLAHYYSAGEIASTGHPSQASLTKSSFSQIGLFKSE